MSEDVGKSTEDDSASTEDSYTITEEDNSDMNKDKWMRNLSHCEIRRGWICPSDLEKDLTTRLSTLQFQNHLECSGRYPLKMSGQQLLNLVHLYTLHYKYTPLH